MVSSIVWSTQHRKLNNYYLITTQHIINLYLCGIWLSSVLNKSRDMNGDFNGYTKTGWQTDTHYCFSRKQKYILCLQDTFFFCSLFSSQISSHSTLASPIQTSLHRNSAFFLLHGHLTLTFSTHLSGLGQLSG